LLTPQEVEEYFVAGRDRGAGGTWGLAGRPLPLARRPLEELHLQRQERRLEVPGRLRHGRLKELAERAQACPSRGRPAPCRRQEGQGRAGPREDLRLQGRAGRARLPGPALQEGRLKTFKQRHPDGAGRLDLEDGRRARACPTACPSCSPPAAPSPRPWPSWPRARRTSTTCWPSASRPRPTTAAPASGRSTPRPCAGRRVVVLPDNDAPGKKHAEQVAASLQGLAVEVRVLELPNLPAKGDVSDWLANGGSRELLLELAAVRRSGRPRRKPRRRRRRPRRPSWRWATLTASTTTCRAARARSRRSRPRTIPSSGC
jgi:hypothetical protein